MAAVVATDLVILCTIDAFRHPGQLHLARRIADLERPTVLVALRMPTDADVIEDLPTALACYSIHDPSTEALAAAIFGELATTGRVPLVDMGRSTYRPLRAAAATAPEDWP